MCRACVGQHCAGGITTAVHETRKYCEVAMINDGSRELRHQLSTPLLPEADKEEYDADSAMHSPRDTHRAGCARGEWSGDGSGDNSSTSGRGRDKSGGRQNQYQQKPPRTNRGGGSGGGSVAQRLQGARLPSSPRRANARFSPSRQQDAVTQAALSHGQGGGDYRSEGEQPSTERNGNRRRRPIGEAPRQDSFRTNRMPKRGGRKRLRRNLARAAAVRRRRVKMRVSSYCVARGLKTLELLRWLESQPNRQLSQKYLASEGGAAAAGGTKTTTAAAAAAEAA
ncbi:unnamed protein product, partial [Pylaiella littoralis]